ncbi:hypothetical protein, partial [Klebsiella aerogenes]|uniref:hypothetical protein n=1 Tax=Klebsiella aerogenes TaxID=548 RepID=UPI0039F020DD
MYWNVFCINDRWFFSYLLKGWPVWDFDKSFPFGKTEIATILKISLLGIPAGLVFWIFDVR